MLSLIETIIGDHSLISMSLRNEKKSSPVFSYRRDWTKYSKEKLILELTQHEMDWRIDDVQEGWNKILNRQIKLDWLNLSLITFKLKAKSLFMTN